MLTLLFLICHRQMQLRPGEASLFLTFSEILLYRLLFLIRAYMLCQVLIDKLDSVEDTKGNNGDRGIKIEWLIVNFTECTMMLYMFTVLLIHVMKQHRISMQRYIKKLLSITNISQLSCQFKPEQMSLNSASTEGHANFI